MLELDHIQILPRFGYPVPVIRSKVSQWLSDVDGANPTIEKIGRDFKDVFDGKVSLFDYCM
jgi:hypothetical protein